MKLLSKSGLIALALIPVSAPAAGAMPSDETAPAGSDGYELGYFLPKGRAAASYSQRIVKCPSTKDLDVIVETRAQIVAKAVPDYSRLYRIDTRAGFLAKRSTDLTLNPNGTIKSINATVEGQGGAVLAATVKLAAFAASVLIGGPAPMAMGDKAPPPSPVLRTACRQEVIDLIAERSALAEQIVRLGETLPSNGLTPEEAAELGYQRERLAALDDALTLSSDPQSIDPAATDPIRIAHLDYAQWFSAIDPADIARLPGNDGVLLQWTVNADARSALNEAASVKPAEVAALSSAPASVIYYRRPVPVAISIVPCTQDDGRRQGRTLHRETPGLACTVDESPDAAGLAVSASAGFPQLSGLFRLTIGRGGLFGSRTIAAEFDETGAPISLRYGSDPGAADIAASITAAQDAATTLRDARADALARRAAMLKSRKDIRDLEAELDK